MVPAVMGLEAREHTREGTPGAVICVMQFYLATRVSMRFDGVP